MNVSRKTWRKLLTYCKGLDVEEGEGDEYQYSVRSSTGIITLWTKNGWRDGYYVTRFVPPFDWAATKKRKFTVTVEDGQPAEHSWPHERAERLLKELVSHAEGLPDED